MSLDILFEQILKSEQNAENRHSKIIKVDKEISLIEKATKDINERIAATTTKIKGELMHRLFEEQTECEVLNSQCESLVLQRDKIKQEIDNVNLILSETDKQKQQELDDFMLDIKQFTERYDLGSSNEVKRHEKYLRELKILQQQEKKELNSLQMLSTQKEKHNSFVENRTHLDSELSNLRAKVIEIDLQLDEKQLKAEDLKKEIDSIAISQRTDPEYCRLQTELQGLDIEKAKDEVKHLQKELAQLQQKRKLTAIYK